MAENLRIPEVNRVILIGRVTRDIELRYTQNNQAVASFNIATNRTYMDQQTSEWKELVSFIPIVLWGKLAENISNRLKKGVAVCVEGRLQSRTYETSKGDKRTQVEVIADRIQVMSKQDKQLENDEQNQNIKKDSNWDVEENINEEDIPF